MNSLKFKNLKKTILISLFCMTAPDQSEEYAEVVNNICVPPYDEAKNVYESLHEDRLLVFTDPEDNNSVALTSAGQAMAIQCLNATTNVNLGKLARFKGKYNTSLGFKIAGTKSFIEALSEQTIDMGTVNLNQSTLDLLVELGQSLETIIGKVVVSEN